MVVAKGATEIVFDTSRWHKSVYSDEIMRRRFDSILAPGPALVGLPSRIGTDGDRSISSELEHFAELCRRGHRFPRPESVLPPGRARYTVTLRNQARKSPYRNSNAGAWRAFADEIGAIVIEDYDDDPLPLHERMALYAGADLNLGVSCGPMFLATLTSYPCMVFNFGPDGQLPFLEIKCRMPYGSRPPWLADNSTVIWERDTLALIRREFRKWQDSR